MPKKTFKENTTHLDRFFTDPSESEAQEHQKHNVNKTQKNNKTKIYRFNLKLKAEYKEYLDLAAWESRKSITQYINELIEADKAAKDLRNK